MLTSIHVNSKLINSAIHPKMLLILPIIYNASIILKCFTTPKMLKKKRLHNLLSPTHLTITCTAILTIGIQLIMKDKLLDGRKK